MASRRKHWLDWERGLAVLFMVEVHTLDAWLAPAARRGVVRDALTMIGGFAAPSFLFLAGLSQVLADAALARRGASPGERRRRALSRAAWLLGVAYAFRLAEYVLGGAFRVPGGWQDVFRVDVLNVIALGLALCAPLLGTPRRLHVALAAGAAAAVALATPPMAGWQHPPSRLLDYLFATYPRANFSLFNWVGFLLAGSAAGALLADGEQRPRLLLGLGAALALAGGLLDLLPPVYAHQAYWITSPCWWAVRLGGVVALTGAVQLVPAAAVRPLAWLSTLGRHSLLGYLASIELTYGFVSHPLHRALPLSTTLLGIAAMTAVTWAMAALVDRRQRRRTAALPPQPPPAAQA